MLHLFMKTLLALGASILLLVELAGCSAEQKELRRQVSPNQHLVAVLMESGGPGALSMRTSMSTIGDFRSISTSRCSVRSVAIICPLSG